MNGEIATHRWSAQFGDKIVRCRQSWQSHLALLPCWRVKPRVWRFITCGLRNRESSGAISCRPA